VPPPRVMVCVIWVHIVSLKSGKPCYVKYSRVAKKKRVAPFNGFEQSNSNTRASRSSLSKDE
jgi:hypothetical protein